MRSTSGGPTVTGEGGKVSSVPTSADPIPEADARKASKVASMETKSRDAEGDGEADVFKEVPQVASLPTPTTEAAPPASEDDGCTLASTKQSMSTEGEGWRGRCVRGRYWEVKEDMFWARSGGMRALQGQWL